jgi:hypothetical protein
MITPKRRKPLRYVSLKKSKTYRLKTIKQQRQKLRRTHKNGKTPQEDG